MVKIVCIDGRNIAHSTSGGKLDWSNLILVVEALVLSKFGEIHLFIPFWARGQIPADLFMILEENVSFHFSGNEEKDRDDKDMIAWAMMLKSYILTNDKMRDHVQNGLIRESDFQEIQIKFKIKKDEVKLIIPLRKEISEINTLPMPMARSPN